MSKVGQGKKDRNYVAELGPAAAVQGEPLTVAHTAVRPNRYNYNKQNPATFNKLVESMRTFGFTLPIIVRRLGKGRWEIIDGEHRWRAAKELAMTEVRIIDLGEVSDERAKQLTIILNELGGSPDQVRLADLLRDINTDVSFDELLKVMPYSEKELDALIGSVDFSFDSLSDEDTRSKEEAAAPAPMPGLEDGEPADVVVDEEVEAPASSGAKPGTIASTPKESRIVLHIPANEAKAFEMQLMQIDDDPLVAVRTAVEHYLAHKQEAPAPKKAKKETLKA